MPKGQYDRSKSKPRGKKAEAQEPGVPTVETEFPLVDIDEPPPRKKAKPRSRLVPQPTPEETRVTGRAQVVILRELDIEMKTGSDVTVTFGGYRMRVRSTP